MIIYLLFLMLLTARVIFTAYVINKAAIEWSDYASAYLEYINNNRNKTSSYKWRLFNTQFKKLPNKYIVLTSLHKWTYESVAIKYKEELSKLYKELTNDV